MQLVEPLFGAYHIEARRNRGAHHFWCLLRTVVVPSQRVPYTRLLSVWVLFPAFIRMRNSEAQRFTLLRRCHPEPGRGFRGRR